CLDQRPPRLTRGGLCSARQLDHLGQRSLRDGEGEGAPLARRALDPDATAVHLHQLPTDCQAKPGALVLPSHAALPLLEALEDAFDVLGVHADSGIAHADAKVRALTLGVDSNAP